MAANAQFVTLKRAAQELGVHEQTLRSWERQGVIRMARLPNSGYRRVPVAEVQRLLALMAASGPLQNVRLDPPRQDEKAIAQAQTLAAAVHAELAALEFPVTFDEWIQARRGRTWLP